MATFADRMYAASSEAIQRGLVIEDFKTRRTERLKQRAVQDWYPILEQHTKLLQDPLYWRDPNKVAFSKARSMLSTSKMKEAGVPVDYIDAMDPRPESLPQDIFKAQVRLSQRKLPFSQRKEAIEFEMGPILDKYGDFIETQAVTMGHLKALHQSQSGAEKKSTVEGAVQPPDVKLDGRGWLYKSIEAGVPDAMSVEDVTPALERIDKSIFPAMKPWKVVEPLFRQRYAYESTIAESIKQTMPPMADYISQQRTDYEAELNRRRLGALRLDVLKVIESMSSGSPQLRSYEQTMQLPSGTLDPFSGRNSRNQFYQAFGVKDDYGDPILDRMSFILKAEPDAKNVEQRAFNEIVKEQQIQDTDKIYALRLDANLMQHERLKIERAREGRAITTAAEMSEQRLSSRYTSERKERESLANRRDTLKRELEGRAEKGPVDRKTGKATAVVIRPPQARRAQLEGPTGEIAKLSTQLADLDADMQELRDEMDHRGLSYHSAPLQQPTTSPAATAGRKKSVGRRKATKTRIMTTQDALRASGIP